MKYSLVIIGASLGGLNAVISIIKKLAKDFPLTLVIIQHREKDSDETLLNLLNINSKIEVIEPDDKDPIQRGNIYLAPPGYHLLFEKNCFHLSLDSMVNYSRPSIDVSFESAAENYGDKVIGIILTGTNNDGAQGLKIIKEAGGYTIVQDPLTAEAPTMPLAAIELSKPDQVLTLDKIGEFLLKIIYE